MGPFSSDQDAASIASSSSGYPLPPTPPNHHVRAKRPSRHMLTTAPLLEDDRSKSKRDRTGYPTADIDQLRSSTESLDGGAPHPRWLDNALPDAYSDPAPFYPEPVDRWRLVYLIFLGLGLALLFPWNAFISAQDFFRVKLANSQYQDNFLNYFSISYTWTNLVVLGICITQQHRVRIRLAIFGCLLVNAGVFLCLAIISRITTLHGEGFFGLVLALLIVGAISSSLMQCAVFALVSRFPPLYIQGALSGQAVAGIIASVVQLITALAQSATTANYNVQASPWQPNYPWMPYYGPQEGWNQPHLPPMRRSFPPGLELHTLELRAFAYFLFTSIICLVVLASFLFLQRLPFYRHFLPKVGETPAHTPFSANLDLVRVTARSILLLVVTIMMLFCITFSVFPSLTAAVKSVNPASTFPFTALHFVLFNVGDWTGRWISMVPWLRFCNDRVIFLGTLSHATFVALFLLCNTSYSVPNPPLIPTVIGSDAAFFVIVTLFGISNGYWGSITMMAGPQKAIDKERAGTVLSFFLVLGMAAGSLVSFAVTALSCNCNPFQIR
ncbi:hypothetical protein IWQ61_009463 [Dispira simplex]|nr:hypothetical protein IWQ61_009463 [Dispira simplex]